jgi:hypothetical protein
MICTESTAAPRPLGTSLNYSVTMVKGSLHSRGMFTQVAGKVESRKQKGFVTFIVQGIHL